MSAVETRRAEQRALFAQERDAALIASYEDAEGSSSSPTVVGHVLATLAEQFRIEGKLLAEQKQRGWKTEVAEVENAAGRIDAVVKSLGARRPYARVVPQVDEGLPDGVAVGGMSNYRPDPEKLAEGIQAGLERMRAITAPAAATPEPSAEVQAWLTGEGPMPDLGPGHVVELPEESPVITPPPLVDPAGFGDPRKQLTRAEVRELAAKRIDSRRSHTRGTLYAECGYRWSMADLELPAWWNVGGTAFHTVAEKVEDGTITATDPAALRTAWERIFASTVEQVEREGREFGLPGRSHWRAAAHGKENGDWWRVEGATMVETYMRVTGRLGELSPADLAAQAISGVDILRLPTLVMPGGRPALELELALPIGEVDPWEAMVDRIVWDGANNRIIIVDLKTGAHEPDEPSQLTDYAHGVRRQFGLPAHIGIDGAFYMARKGSVIVHKGLESVMPYEDFADRVTTEDRGIRAGIILANVGLGCKSCGAAKLCPAYSK